MAARLHGCKAAWLQGCKAAWLQGCTAARLHGCECGDELMWSIVHNNSKARWGPVVFPIYV